MVQLRGNCKLRGKMCFMASVLKCASLRTIIYSWSAGFHEKWWPHWCSEAGGAAFPPPGSHGKALWEAAEPPALLPKSYSLRKQRDWQGELFFLAFKTSKENYHVFLATWCYQNGNTFLRESSLQTLRRKAGCKCLEEKQTPSWKLRGRKVWLPIPVVSFLSGVTLSKIAPKAQCDHLPNRDNDSTHFLG